MKHKKVFSILLCTLLINNSYSLGATNIKSVDNKVVVVNTERTESKKIDIEKIFISTDKNLFKKEQIKNLHEQMYWAKDWSDEKIQKNIDNSDICFGAYDEEHNNTQIGFARVVTDFSTICYILDVVVDTAYRCCSIGTKLIKTILEKEELKECSFVLATSAQAKNFYKSLGFEIKDGKYMLFKNK